MATNSSLIGLLRRNSSAQVRLCQAVGATGVIKSRKNVLEILVLALIFFGDSAARDVLVAI